MTELSGKRIVMTGATGFIGSHVAKRFLDAGGRGVLPGASRVSENGVSSGS